MKAKTEYEQNIIKVNMKISVEFNEISIYIAEISGKETSINSPTINRKSVKQYYHSFDNLDNMILEYVKTHRN